MVGLPTECEEILNDVENDSEHEFSFDEFIDEKLKLNLK